MEVAPRTRIFGAVPKVPETFWTDTPATWPSREREMSAIPASFALSASTLVAEPVLSRRSMVCIPVATAASRTVESSCRTNFRVSASGSRSSLYPMQEAMMNFAFAGTFLMVKLPSRSDIVPTDWYPST